VIDHVHPPANLFAAERLHLFLGILAMASDDDQDAYVLVGDPRLGNRVEEGRQDEVHALPASGDVADGDGYLVRGAEQLPQGGGVDGPLQGRTDGPGDVMNGRVILSDHLTVNLLHGKGKRHLPLAVFEANGPCLHSSSLR
jgi:hypothetical protein